MHGTDLVWTQIHIARRRCRHRIMQPRKPDPQQVGRARELCSIRVKTPPHLPIHPVMFGISRTRRAV